MATSTAPLSGSRKASHAGSWYNKNGTALAGQLSGWLSDAKTPLTNARGVIAPHAGYSYSGPAAGWSYSALRAACTGPDSRVIRIFILGPSHHHSTRVCELSQCAVYQTPVGDITLDSKVISELSALGVFGKMKTSVDEAEHSIEMQLPYIAHIMKGYNLDCF